MQKEIIETLHVQPTVDPLAAFAERVQLLQDYLVQTGQKTYVLGISGGQDSTLAGKMAQAAVQGLRETTGDNTYQFIAMRLPYGTQSDEQDALDAIAWQAADQTIRVDIKPATDAMVAEIMATGTAISDFNKGNVKARQRMIAQYAVAGANQGLVIGTDHAAEALTGFYTKFGDGAADITPLYGLDKRQGRAMLEALEAPEHLYAKVPTADLEEERPALPDEIALGVTYADIDTYLEGGQVPAEVAERIEGIYRRSEHKRRGPVTLFDRWWRR